MRTVVQRVSHGQVIVEDNCVAKIGKGGSNTTWNFS